PVFVQAIPNPEGDAEEPLATHRPVPVEPLHPGSEAGAHVRRVPSELAAELEKALSVLDGLDEPLPARHHFERSVPPLVELHRVTDGLRFTEQVAAFLEELRDPSASPLG